MPLSGRLVPLLEGLVAPSSVKKRMTITMAAIIRPSANRSLSRNLEHARESVADRHRGGISALGEPGADSRSGDAVRARRASGAERALVVALGVLLGGLLIVGHAVLHLWVWGREGEPAPPRVRRGRPASAAPPGVLSAWRPFS